MKEHDKMNNNDTNVHKQIIEANLERLAQKEKAAALSPHPPEMEELLAQNKANKAALKTAKLLPTITAGKLIEADLPPAEMLLAPWLKRKTIANLDATAGIGKTWAALTIAQALATGSKAFGRWGAPQPRRILYLDGEMALEEMRERLQMLEAAGDNIILYNPDLDPDSPSVNIANVEWQERILYTIKECNIDVVIVDNVASLYRNGENSNGAESWGVMQEFLLKLRREKLGVIVVDHTSKDKEAKTPRGSSAKIDVINFGIILKRPEGYKPEDGAEFVVEFFKNRSAFGDDVRPFVAALVDGKWQTEDYTPTPCNKPGRKTNDANYMAVVEAFNAGTTSPKAISEQTGVPEPSVKRYLKNIRTGWTGAGTTDYIADDYSDYQ